MILGDIKIGSCYIGYRGLYYRRTGMSSSSQVDTRGQISGTGFSHDPTTEVEPWEPSLATPTVDPEEWLDLILKAPDRGMQLRALTAMLDEVRRNTRLRAEGIIRNALTEVGNG